MRMQYSTSTHFDLKLAQVLVEDVLGALLLLADLLLELLALAARQVRQALLRGHRAHCARERRAHILYKVYTVYVCVRGRVCVECANGLEQERSSQAHEAQV